MGIRLSVHSRENLRLADSVEFDVRESGVLVSVSRDGCVAYLHLAGGDPLWFSDLRAAEVGLGALAKVRGLRVRVIDSRQARSA